MKAKAFAFWIPRQNRSVGYVSLTSQTSKSVRPAWAVYVREMFSKFPTSIVRFFFERSPRTLNYFMSSLAQEIECDGAKHLTFPSFLASQTANHSKTGFFSDSRKRYWVIAFFSITSLPQRKQRNREKVCLCGRCGVQSLFSVIMPIYPTCLQGKKTGTKVSPFRSCPSTRPCCKYYIVVFHC